MRTAPGKAKKRWMSGLEMLFGMTIVDVYAVLVALMRNLVKDSMGNVVSFADDNSTVV